MAALVPTEAAGQALLGDEDEREARRQAVLADMETRVAALGEFCNRPPSGSYGPTRNKQNALFY